MDLPELSVRQTMLAEEQKSPADVLEGLRARHEAGEKSAAIMADLTHVAWASVRFNCVVTPSYTTKVLALAMLCQSEGVLPTAVTDIGVMGFGAALPDVVRRVCSLNQLEPPWVVKVGPEMPGGTKAITIERTLGPSIDQQ